MQDANVIMEVGSYALAHVVCIMEAIDNFLEMANIRAVYQKQRQIVFEVSFFIVAELEVHFEWKP